MQGGLARFINHSCAANCFTKIVTLNGDKHIIISAKRDIARGEELTYDYKVRLCLSHGPCKVVYQVSVRLRLCLLRWPCACSSIFGIHLHKQILKVLRL